MLGKPFDIMVRRVDRGKFANCGELSNFLIFGSLSYQQFLWWLDLEDELLVFVKTKGCG